MIRFFTSTACLLLAGSAVVAAQQTVPNVVGEHNNADVAAIEATLAHAAEGWAKWDADQATSNIAEHGYWINAFGVAAHSRVEARDALAAIFARHKNEPPRSFSAPSISIRFIHPDLAWMEEYVTITGQLNRDGSPMPMRKAHTFRLMMKEHGQWVAESTVIMDEKS